MTIFHGRQDFLSPRARVRISGSSGAIRSIHRRWRGHDGSQRVSIARPTPTFASASRDPGAIWNRTRSPRTSARSHAQHRRDRIAFTSTVRCTRCRVIQHPKTRPAPYRPRSTALQAGGGRTDHSVLHGVRLPCHIFRSYRSWASATHTDTCSISTRSCAPIRPAARARRRPSAQVYLYVQDCVDAMLLASITRTKASTSSIRGDATAKCGSRSSDLRRAGDSPQDRIQRRRSRLEAATAPSFISTPAAFGRWAAPVAAAA